MGFALSDMQLTSPAFEDGGRIPEIHTGEGTDVSPQLVWSNVPDGTEGFAVLCHDPDAPLVSPGNYGFVHWVLYDVPGDITELPQGASYYTAGTNNFDRQGYAGPMPPPGHGEHRYFFWLLALKSRPELKAGLTMWQLLGLVESEVIGMNRLMGTYSR